MTPWRNVVTSLLGACVLASGCSIQGAPEDVPVEPISVPYTTLDHPISGNGLSPADFWNAQNQQDLRTLGGAALLTAGGTLVATPLLNTAGGRSVLRYAFSCALSNATTVQSAAGHAFTGDFGLASDWLSRALTTSEQRWLTSCVLVHLNGVGASVPILLLGNHPAFVPAAGDDLSAFTIKDMTAFGNIFAPTPTAYVCTDLGLDVVCGGLLNNYVLERLCDTALLCGITFLGPCNLPLLPVCTYDASGNPTCATGLPSTTYTQSIATKLDQSGGLSLYPLCSLL